MTIVTDALVVEPENFPSDLWSSTDWTTVGRTAAYSSPIPIPKRPSTSRMIVNTRSPVRGEAIGAYAGAAPAAGAPAVGTPYMLLGVAGAAYPGTPYGFAGAAGGVGATGETYPAGAYSPYCGTDGRSGAGGATGGAGGAAGGWVGGAGGAVGGTGGSNGRGSEFCSDMGSTLTCGSHSAIRFASAQNARQLVRHANRRTLD